MAITAKRPLPIWRRDSSNSTILAAGTADSGVAPACGHEAITVLMRLPTGGGTLTIQQRLRTSGTWATTDTFTLAGAGVVSDAAVRTGEVVRAVFTNGASDQKPEIFVSLE